MANLAGRLNWKHTSVIITLATILPPYTTSPIVIGVPGALAVTHMPIAIYALFWAIFPPESSMSGLQVLNYYALPTCLLLGVFNIVFAFQVIRFIRGAASRRNTLLVGALTLVIPVISLILTWPFMELTGVFVYIGPIPIQLFTGLLLMYVAGPKDSASPW
jgi:hypothetical protein